MFRLRFYNHLAKAFPNSRCSIRHDASDKVQCLQTADIVTGILRRHRHEDDVDNFKKISLILEEFREIFIS